MITLDFETYYCKASGYTLSKLTTEAYIRDPRFEVIGVSVMVDDQPPQWCYGDFATIFLFLKSFDLENQAIASHNAAFDMAILAWRFGIVPKFIVDTMSMARSIHGINSSVSLAALAKLYQLPDKGHQVESADGLRLADMNAAFLADYGSYCCHDTWLCRQLFKLLRSKLPTEEMMAIDWTLQCYAQPTLMIDVAKAQEALNDHIRIKHETLAALGVSQEALRSDEVMSELLIQLGVLPPRKLSPKQKEPDGSPKEVWAFAKSDTEFMDLLEHDDPRVVALVEARLANKTSIVETRLQAFVDIGRRGRLPYPLAYAAAQPTLRWQAAPGQQINLQNLPRAKKGERSVLRDAIVAPPGYKLGVIDLSQIELRVNCWQSGQRNVLDMLASGGDVYSHNATPIFGFAVQKKNHPVERFVGKVATLSAQYGVGGPKFTLMLRVAARRDGFKLADESEPFGQKCVDVYRDNNPYIKAFWRQAERALEIMATGGCGQLGPYEIRFGAIMLPDGMAMYYPNLRRYTDPISGREGWVYDKYYAQRRRSYPKWIYGAMLVENISQRVARCVMRDGILRLRQRFWVAGSVHDEALFLVPEHENEAQVMDYAVACMTQPAVWAPDMPLAAEGGIGRCYGDAK